MLDRLYRFFDIPYRLSFRKFGDWSDKSKPVLVLIHGIGVNYKIWRKLIDKLPNTPILAVDLLGFGASKKPRFLDYSLRDQSRALRKTVRKVARGRKLVLCGHSLGSLVAVEFARRYQNSVDRLLLCSPPIYELDKAGGLPSREAILEQIGKKFLSAIEASSGKRIAAANAYRLHQKNFYINPKDISPYVKTARSSILGQTTIKDLAVLNLPIEIVYGSLDTVMIPANFRKLKKANSNIVISSVVAGHEMNAAYTNRLVKMIDPSAPKKKPLVRLASFRRKA